MEALKMVMAGQAALFGVRLLKAFVPAALLFPLVTKATEHVVLRLLRPLPDRQVGVVLERPHKRKAGVDSRGQRAAPRIRQEVRLDLLQVPGLVRREIEQTAKKRA